MARPRKLRAISIEVFWSDAERMWIGWLPVKDADGNPVKDARGNPKRLKRSSTRPGEEGRLICEQKIRDLEDELAEEAARRAANVRPKGKVMRVHAWLRYWLYEIKEPKVSYNAFNDYRKTMLLDIIPNLDDCDFPELEAKGIEAMIKRIRRKHPGSTDKPNRAYRHLRMALRAAAARPKETGLWDNPILAVDMPAHSSPKVTPFTADQTKLIMAAARTRERNRARWTVAWAFGYRPGEARAFMRSDFYLVYADTGDLVPEDLWYSVDLDQVHGVLVVNDNLYRRKWVHGCADPHACGEKYHRYPCPETGYKHDRYHRNGCPQVKTYCPPGCIGHAKQCGSGHGGLSVSGEPMPAGQVRKAPKSEAGKRKMFLTKGPTKEMLAHLRQQDTEIAEKGEAWLGSGALFAGRMGGVLNERDDYEEFAAILDAAGIKYQRPYDGRHGAATLLLKKKAPKRYVMEAMGWSSESMLLRYQHFLDEMRVEVGEALGSELFPDEPDTALDTAGVIELDQHRRKRA